MHTTLIENKPSQARAPKRAMSFIDRVALRIMASPAAQLNDLSGIAVIVPNSHVATELTQALERAATAGDLSLPTMTTLNDWAQKVGIDATLVSDSQRSAMLYQLLRDKQWFEHTDLWSLTQELLALFDELTQSLDDLPRNADEFAAAVEQSYQARQNSTLHLEARLVFELWHAMLDGKEVDAARSYQQRLAKIADKATKPLFVLRTSDWNLMEQGFLEEYAEKAAVTVYDLRTETLEDPHVRFLRAALSGDVDQDFRKIAAETKGIPSMTGRLRLFGASSLEQEARAAAMQVRLWLQQGKREIAIVAQDRLVARRLRALLERVGVLVADETGWTFATLSVSTVLDRWLTALQSDFYHHDLLDLLKSPYIFADMPQAERKAVVHKLEQVLRKRSVVSGLDNFAALVAQNEALRQPFERLRQAADIMGQGKRRPLAEWLKVLGESLQSLSVDVGLQRDAAGVQLLKALDTWAAELGSDKGTYSISEWRRWLAQRLDKETYNDSSIESTVRLTHLAATRCRTFEAVLLLGCDAEHLPGSMDGTRWFNDAVRGSLNLLTREAYTARIRDDLCGLLSLNNCVLVTWQSDHNGETCLLSPYLEILRGLHALAYGEDLADTNLQPYLDVENELATGDAPMAQPRPIVQKGAVPSSVSISGYNSLVACPYQYFARYVLRLNELDEVQEGLEKRDYGELVHGILRRFQDRHPRVTGQPVGQMEAALRQLSEEVFAELVSHDFEARAWLVRWLGAIPAYIAWQTENEAQGWTYAESETAFELQLDGVMLRGRIDRVDTNGAAKRVFDYKLQNDQALRDKLREPGEDVQLPCYAYANNAQDAAFVSIDGNKVKAVETKQDMSLLADLNVERLVQVMKRVRAGEGLPANGVEATCEYCEMRGVCRKSQW